MNAAKDRSRIFTRQEVERLLQEATGKTLLEADATGLFARHEGHNKMKGIAGDIIEEGVLGCKRDSKQEPDILVDGEFVEIKTTGLIKPRRKDTPYEYECKEPVSVTAVSIPTIVNQEFESSIFWHKLAHLLWVYYWYKSTVSVKLENYKDFPILGFQFYEFSEEDQLRLKEDWLLVRNFLIAIHREYSTEAERAEQHPRLSHELRSELMLIDTAPKYPNPPRFRLKRAFATTIADKLFSRRKLEKLKQPLGQYTEIDEKCQHLTQLYGGKTFAEISKELDVVYDKNIKNFAERAVVAMFGGHVARLNDIEDFAKIGIIAKSVPLKANGNGKEDMKLFLPNLIEWTEEESFEDSAICDFFSGHHFMLIVYRYLEDGTHTFDHIVFEGFKRVTFSDDFINSEVRKLWQDVRELIMQETLQIVRRKDRYGNDSVNASGSYKEAPNFPKKATHKVFIRGGASTSEDKHKTLEINGLRMIPQFVWLSHGVVKPFLENK